MQANLPVSVPAADTKPSIDPAAAESAAPATTQATVASPARYRTLPYDLPGRPQRPMSPRRMHR